MKKLLSLALAFAVVFGINGTAAADDSDASTGREIEQSSEYSAEGKNVYESLDDFRKVAQVNGKELYVLYNKTDLIVGYADSDSPDMVLYTSPADYALGETKNMNAAAQLVVQYLDKNGNSRSVNSLTGSVRTGNCRVEQIKDGLIITYNFTNKSEDFSVPVRFSLGNTGLSVSVLFDGIKENSESKILKISLLPYMGCASGRDEGYFFLPDGSGAIANFKAENPDVTTVSMPVYGRDSILSVATLTNQTQTVTMPVFGINKTNGAMFAVIEKGEALSTINASQAASDGEYSTVYSEFVYRCRDEVSLGDAWNSSTYTQCAVKTSQINEVTVLYNSLNKENSGYVGMAGFYRNYLIDSGIEPMNETDGGLPVYLDVIGAVKKKQSVLGFVRNKVTPMTTYAQTGEILDWLQGKGIVDVTVRIRGGLKGGLDDSAVTEFKTERRLGGNKAYSELRRKAEKLGSELYADVEFLNIHRSKFGWKPYQYASQSVYRSPAEIKLFDLSSSLVKKNDEAYSYYLMSPNSLTKEVNKFTKKYSKNKNGAISAGTLGSLVYSDFSGKNFTDRATAQEKIVNAMELLTSESGKFPVDTGNLYALPFASAIIGAPGSDSGYTITETGVPFLAIALHGLVEYTLPAANFEISFRDMLLHQIETGAAPYYITVYEDVYTLRDTNQEWLYTGTWKQIRDNLVSNYEELNSVLTDVRNLPITDHKVIGNGLCVTTYGDKLSVAVNYGNEPAVYNGKTVDAKNYLAVNVLGKGESPQ